MRTLRWKAHKEGRRPTVRDERNFLASNIGLLVKREPTGKLFVVDVPAPSGRLGSDVLMHFELTPVDPESEDEQ